MKKLLYILFLLPVLAFGQTQIKTTQINPTLPAKFQIGNNGKILGADSLYLGTQNTYATPSGSITFLGTSITVGVGASPSTLRYSTLVANALGLTENNHGASGATVEKRSPTNVPNFIDSMVVIPSYSAGVTRWLVIETGPNDFNLTSANYNPTNYQTDLTTVVNYAISTKGWPANKILLLSNSYFASFGYNGTTKTPAIYSGFITASQTVATNLGTLYLNIEDWLNKRGGNFLMSDYLHPNNAGHATQANGILSVLAPGIVYKKGQNLALNGVSEFSNIKLSAIANSIDASPTLLGISSDGSIGKVSSIPNNIRFAGNAYLGGLVIDTPVTYTFTPAGKSDWILSPKNIYGMNADPAKYTITQLNDAGAGYTFQTIYNTSSFPLMTFKRYDGTVVMTIARADGALALNGNINMAYPAAGVFAAAGGATQAGLVPFYGVAGQFSTRLQTDYGNAYIGFLTSHGTTGSLNEDARFSNKGNFLIGGNVDDGWKFEIEGSNKGRSDGGHYFGRVPDVTLSGNPTTSTTGGILTAATYFYYVVAVDANGNTTNATTSQGSVTTTGSTSSNTINWTNVAGAISYRVYRGTSSGGEDRYFTATGTPGLDIGSGYTIAAPPTVNSTYYAGISSTGVMFPANYTVSNLPSASSNKSGILVVTDANSPTWGATVSGGGSTTVTVISNGTNWIVN